MLKERIGNENESVSDGVFFIPPPYYLNVVSTNRPGNKPKGLCVGVLPCLEGLLNWLFNCRQTNVFSMDRHQEDVHNERWP